MGKVVEKLAKLPAVKSLVEGSDGIAIVLHSGQEKVCKTAHEARLFIQEHSAATGRKPRLTVVVNEDGTQSAEPAVFVPQVPRYPGMAKAAMRAGEDYVAVPIWERDKGFSPNTAEGKDAFLRGYDRKSHGYGESSAAKEFELSWDAAKRNADSQAAEQVQLPRAA